MLIYRSVRAHEFCEGGEDGPHGCPNANEVTCRKCGHRREVDDTNAPGPCPQCGDFQYVVNRCERCPVNELEHVRTHSSAGRLFERVLELDFDCTHLSVPWSEVTAEEVKGLQILQDERDKYQREQMKDTNRVSPEEARMLKLLERQRQG